MLRHLRFHGRGGEGVKLASRIISRAAFLSGMTVQDSPLYGAERRGAPVVAFARIADRPILERGYIDSPDVVIVLDASLVWVPAAAVLNGIDASCLLLLNCSNDAPAAVHCRNLVTRVVGLDVSSIALEVTGHHILSAAMAGFVAKATGLVSADVLDAAVRIELAAIHVDPQRLEANLAATRRAYDAAPAVGVKDTVRQPRMTAAVSFTLPRLPARLAAPSIGIEATSALRRMDGWRVYRPQIDLAGCTRCFVCFALCPEGAIDLDAQSYPVVDLAHCKGCLVCVHECPTHTISEIREVAA